MSDYQFNPNQEQWKAIPGFPGYEVSDHGRVKSFPLPGPYKGKSSTKILKSFPDKNGYAKIRLSKNGKMFDFKAHQLVLLAFIGPCPAGMQACHNDGTKRDHLLNLRWDTPKNNQHDRRKHGTDIYGFGENHSQAKLTEQDVLKIRWLHDAWGCNRFEIAKGYHVHPGTIWSILKRKTWKHI